MSSLRHHSQCFGARLISRGKSSDQTCHNCSMQCSNLAKASFMERSLERHHQFSRVIRHARRFDGCGRSTWHMARCNDPRHATVFCSTSSACRRCHRHHRHHHHHPQRGGKDMQLLGVKDVRSEALQVINEWETSPSSSCLLDNAVIICGLSLLLPRRLLLYTTTPAPLLLFMCTRISQMWLVTGDVGSGPTLSLAWPSQRRSHSLPRIFLSFPACMTESSGVRHQVPDLGREGQEKYLPSPSAIIRHLLVPQER